MFATGVVVVGGIIVLLMAWGLWARAGETDKIETVPTTKVTRGPLTVSVTVGGALQAMENLDVKSEVQGNNQILQIVPEGYVVTDQDVKDGKVLVQLDTSGLEDQQASRAIQVQSAQADEVQAEQNLIIQKKQNESDIATAELNLKFARMALSEYLGDEMAKQLLAGNFDFTQLIPLASYQVEDILTQKKEAALASASGAQSAKPIMPTPAAGTASAAASSPQSADPPSSSNMAPSVEAKSAVLTSSTTDTAGANTEDLGTQMKVSDILGDLYEPVDQKPGTLFAGTAEQSLRQYASSVQLANQDKLQSGITLSWTEKLVASNYETKTQLASDQLDYNRKTVALKSSIEDLRLFIRFTLPKQAEQDYSDYLEAQRNLDRVNASAAGKLAQATANLASKKATLALQQEQYDKGQQMLTDSVIKATKPGMVVYASTTDPRHFQNNPIQEGTSVRENETIFSLPNMNTLAAKVSVYETDISKIKVGQPAIITVGALRGRSFPAHVAKISVMASSENRWLNPDVMVYDTYVALNNVPKDGSLTAGMSATAQIIVAQLKNAIYVPLQAINTYNGKRVCYVKGSTGPERRTITTGYFTDKYVEVTKGLSEGETVYLAPPPEFAAEAAAGAKQPQSDEQQSEQKGEEGASGSAQGEQKAAPAKTETGENGAKQPAAGAQQGARGGMPQLDPTVMAKMRELRGLSGDARTKKLQEIRNSLSDDQKKQFDQMMQRWQQFGGRGGGRGGRGPGGAGGGRRQQEAAQ